jgi:hypothetical protein
MSLADNNIFGAVPMITAALSLVVIYANARFGIRNKQTDHIAAFHKQFDELQKKRTEVLVAQAEKQCNLPGVWSEQRMSIEADLFFDRFWSLQFDEFLAWYEGYVPTSLYVYWAFSRWRELHKATSEWTIAGKTMASTLDELKNRWQSNPDKSSKLSVHVTKFLGLMYALKQNAAYADVDKLLVEYGPSRFRKAARACFGAY